MWEQIIKTQINIIIVMCGCSLFHQGPKKLKENKTIGTERIIL